MARCRACNRELKDPVSALRGIGPICAQKERKDSGSDGSRVILIADRGSSRTWLFIGDQKATVRIYPDSEGRTASCSSCGEISSPCQHIAAVAIVDRERFSALEEINVND